MMLVRCPGRERARMPQGCTAQNLALHRDMPNLWTQMGKGEGGMNGESSMETYILPYVKYVASGNLLSDTGSSNWGSVTT